MRNKKIKLEGEVKYPKGMFLIPQKIQLKANSPRELVSMFADKLVELGIEWDTEESIEEPIFTEKKFIILPFSDETIEKLSEIGIIPQINKVITLQNP